MKVICIDSSNKPDKVPDYEWIKEGIVYTVIQVVEMGLQKNKLGVKLKEVDLSEESFPYQYYDLDRFIPVQMLNELYQEKEKIAETADLELI
jgi:hypothetical protein